MAISLATILEQSDALIRLTSIDLSQSFFSKPLYHQGSTSPFHCNNKPKIVKFTKPYQVIPWDPENKLENDRPLAPCKDYY
jgi:hypothetical protein